MPWLDTCTDLGWSWHAHNWNQGQLVPSTGAVDTEEGYGTRFTVHLSPCVLPHASSHDDESDLPQAR